VLGGANLLSILGCACVPFAVRRGRLFTGGAVALGVCAASALALALPPQASVFVAASVVYTMAWAAAVTLLMAAMPGFDPVGRYVMLIPTALCVGNGVGAAIGGALMEGLGAGHAFAFAAGCCALSGGIVALLGRQSSGAAAAGAMAAR
jgi:predicted MFS family arabinose efflux permease